MQNANEEIKESNPVKAKHHPGFYDGQLEKINH
jgi:hypothetical protein